MSDIDIENIWIHLDHPCYGADVCYDDQNDLGGQGYMRLSKLRSIVAEFNQCQQMNFENGRDVEKRVAGYGELEY